MRCAAVLLVVLMALPGDLGDDFDAQRVIDYLGQTAPVSFKDQPALPVAGPTVGASAGPAGGAGTGGPRAPLPFGSTGGGGLTKAEQNRLLSLIGEGVKLGDLATRLLGTESGGTRGGSTQGPSGSTSDVVRSGDLASPSGLEASRMTQDLINRGFAVDDPAAFTARLRGMIESGQVMSVHAPQVSEGPPDIPLGPISSVPSFGTVAGPADSGAAPTGSAIEPASVAGQGSVQAGADTAAGSAGPGSLSTGIARAAFGALNTAGRATSENPPSKGEQAALAAHELIGMPLADAFTFGTAEAGPVIGREIGGPFGQVLQGVPGFINQGTYGATRAQAGENVTTELGQLSSAYTAAANSGDLGDIQKALATGDPSGRVRGDLQLSPAIAAQLGLPDRASWGSLSTEQFGRVLDYFEANPDALNTAVIGSGDVPYLPYETAQLVADQAAFGTRLLLQHAIGQRKATRDLNQFVSDVSAREAPAPPPPPPTAPAAAVSPGGGGASSSGLTTQDVNDVIKGLGA